MVERDSTGVRVRCTTQKGKHFALVLTDWPQKDGVYTRVKIEWEDGSDDPLAVRILAGLETLSAR